MASTSSLLARYVPALGALKGYRPRDARSDLVAGLTVAAVAVPQAMAYGIAAGVGPEYGLYTAIVMTAVGALFDSSRQLINGPTNVISIAVLSALAALDPEDRVAAAITLALLVGLFQAAITLLRLGDLTRYISHSVVVGFTLGASALLFLDQARNLFGWPSRGGAHDHFLVRLWHTWSEGGAPHLATVAIGAGSIAAIVAIGWLKRRIGWPLFPELLAVLIATTAIVAGFGLDQRGVAVIGEIPRSLPSLRAPSATLDQVRELAPSALAIATLGLLEALAMAKHIASGTKQKLDLNQQCLSEGLANIAGSFFQCFPGSGSLTRSAINQQAGAVSQWSGVVSALAVALIVVLFAPLARYVPRAALAGILIVSAVRIIEWRALTFHLRVTRFDAAIVLVTAISAVAFSIELCILIGVLASFLLAVPRAGQMIRTEFLTAEGGVRERAEEDVPPDDLLIFGLEGELFFGSTIVLDDHLDYIEKRATETGAVVILRVKRLRNPDAVGVADLARFLRHANERGIHVILSGVRPDLLAGLEKSGVLAELRPDQVFRARQPRGSSTIEAIEAARAYLAERAKDRE